MTDGNELAHPRTDSAHNRDFQVTAVYSVGGLTKREYMASLAMAAIISAPNDSISQDMAGNCRANPDELGKKAVEFADALIESLNTKP